ncbi:MAG: hypothetical protein AMJ65_11180 [Phycisphaerae bacterium SG8_4]|nr:MAG: hypothetical protein AMJ65_11180 [Phycisphaerae bacterium SG8_4]
MIRKGCLIILILLFNGASGSDAPVNQYAQWQNGPPQEIDFFPIAVWLQNPANAAKYKQAGINTYVALWRGPTAQQLADLKEAGMKVICHQNKAGLQHADDPTIIGWMHGDEPDNAQSLGRGKGYGPPIEPSKIVEGYNRIRKADPTRPVLLNLGQGVAWDQWHGRGVRTNHPEDYPQYLKGCDIASFDIYPAAHDKPQVAGNLWYVARGVERLVKWTEGKKPVWNCIECTRIHNPTEKATPHEVRCEVWMSIIHGSTGLVYFVHEWEPKFNESALLSDPSMLSAVTALNKQIAGLAPVLNSPTIAGGAAVSSDNNAVPIASMVKRRAGETYVFAVAMRGDKTTATFTLRDLPGAGSVEVLGENRAVTMQNGVFTDSFGPWDVHLYRIP